jgi:tryptophan-rich sensory protein
LPRRLFGPVWTAVVLFVVQRVANSLWALVVATMVLFWRVKALAAALLTPCPAGVSFATLLTFSTRQLNKGVL